jgi:ABC-2 type transport system ATP-binding protein
MKQRVGIAQALVGDPKLIIVDKPTADLDPSERNRFYNLLADVGKDVIVILSTHIVDDVRELCTKLAIMNLSETVYHSSPQIAIEELNNKLFQKIVIREELQDYAKEFKIISNKMVGGRPLIYVFSDAYPQNGFEQVTPNLEDVFFSKINTSNKLV